VVAVKTCRENLSDEQKKKFIVEGRILRQYDHVNIVKFVGIAAQKNPVMIVMEYVSGKLVIAMGVHFDFTSHYSWGFSWYGSLASRPLLSLLKRLRITVA